MKEWGLTPPLWRALPDDDRDLLLAESALVCSHCGNLRSVCSRPGGSFYPQREECYVIAARDLTMRRLAKKYKAEPNAEEMHPLDGVSVWMAEYDLDPEDTFFDMDTPRTGSTAADEADGDVDPGE